MGRNVRAGRLYPIYGSTPRLSLTEFSEAARSKLLRSIMRRLEDDKLLVGLAGWLAKS